MGVGGWFEVKCFGGLICRRSDGMQFLDCLELSEGGGDSDN